MGEKLVCTYAYQIFRGVYTRFSRGKFEYIPIFPGANSSIGEKLGCNTGTVLTYNRYITMSVQF